MRLVHLTSSTFFGGPERQMLGLAHALPETVRTTFISFAEGGRSAAFLDEVRSHAFDTIALKNDFPRVVTAVGELDSALRESKCNVLLCHGYKANILGRVAARRVGIPAVAVSRGWTGENRKVRAYEWLDRRHLKWMDHVVCVSDGQAAKVRRWCRVSETRLTVIRNSARLAAFETSDPDARRKLRDFFPNANASQIVLAAGRFSPEKGFSVLIDAAASFLRSIPSAVVVLFGDGTLRPELEAGIRARGLADRFAVPGFRSDLDSLIAAADVVVLPSFTEGLPNVALEASAAGVPVVATAVGGTPEVIADGETGFLVPPGNPPALAAKVEQLLRNAELRRRFGEAGRSRMRQLFTFEAQAAAYLNLFDTLLKKCPKPVPVAA
jgi:glycosyltransferase involved in cell wall biosynthesis